jgi:hypothetical protein
MEQLLEAFFLCDSCQDSILVESLKGHGKKTIWLEVNRQLNSNCGLVRQLKAN